MVLYSAYSVKRLPQAHAFGK